MMSRIKPVIRDTSVKPPTVNIRSIIAAPARAAESDGQPRKIALRILPDHTARPCPAKVMTAPIVPVVLAGGTGTRLWPVSRDASPKQFLPFNGPHSTYQETLLRVADPMFAPPVVVTGRNLHARARQQADVVGIEATIVVEPVRRDSAAAIAAACALVCQRDPDAVVLVLPADHIVLDNAAFRQTCAAARAAAEAGHIVTFGIEPTGPKTGFGYIRLGKAIKGQGVRKVKSFIEKPTAERAARYVKDGYLWNSGNFLFRADTMMRELKRHAPDVATAATTSVDRANNRNGIVRLHADTFSRAPRISIDYAVMEKTDRAAVVTATFGWQDVGNWDALATMLAPDADGNVVQGHGVSLDSQDCIIHAGDRLVAVIGVKDLVVVDTADAVMVVPRRRAQDVKEMVSLLKAAKRLKTATGRSARKPQGERRESTGSDN
jgi:mannose-1-phosphate guanylyltransferase/mannose-6-phosphate isomerase